MGHPAGSHEPRFVDAHIHIKRFEGIASIAAAGIAAVRDAGTRDNAERRTVPTARHGGSPDILSACWALYKKGGYGSRLGMPVETRADISAEILKLKNAGAGIIKVMASGIVSIKDPGRVTAGGFDRDELRFLVNEAALHGLRVMAHANGEQAILNAADAGVHSVEHGFFMTEHALKALSDKKIFWVPTVGALARAARAGMASRGAEKFFDDLIRDHLRMIG